MRRAANAWARCCAWCDLPMAEACDGRQQPKRVGKCWVCANCFEQVMADFRQRAADRLATLAAMPPAQRTQAESDELVRMLLRKERRRVYQRDWNRMARTQVTAPGWRHPGEGTRVPRKGPGRIGIGEVWDVLAKVG